MRAIILGCGTSSGVPRIGGDWGACDPNDPRNRRTRASILVQSESTTILVDTGPDMRAQLLAAGVDSLDAVIWTHEHADHCHGIDDLRQIFHVHRRPIDGYARSDTLRLLEERFAYVFNGRSGYPSTAAGHVLEEEMLIGDILVRTVAQPHGDIVSAGLRFDHGGMSIGYATDFHAMTAEMERLYRGVDLWIVDALRQKPHPTHPHLREVIGWCADLKPGRAVLTHMDQSMDYADVTAQLPDGIEPGFDGLEVRLA